jgi:hypothetical protein
MADELQEELTPSEAPQEEAPEEVTEEQAPDQGDESTENTEVESNEGLSERGQKRFRDLANKANKADELEKKLAELEPLVAKKQEVDPLRALEDFEPKLTGDYEFDIRTVEDRATKKAIESVQKEQAKKEALVRDVLLCEEAYPELRKGSESYDEQLSQEVINFYNDIKAINPDVRLKAVVDRIMRVKGHVAEKSKEQVAQTIRKQESEGALSPTTAQKNDRKPEEMSLEEIEREVGTVPMY